MVLGDVQVLGQVRDAYRAARHARTIGAELDRLLQRALCAGRRARAETRIASGNASMPSAAIGLLRSELGSLTGRDIAVIGAGETGRLLVTNAMTDRSVRVTVVNRTLARAARLSGAVGVRAAPLSALPDVLAQADAVVSATAAPGTIITATDVSRAMAARRTRHLFIVDLAVPRDVDPSAVYVPGVTLLTADAVQRVREATLAHRAAEIPAVEAIVDEELARLAGRCRRVAGAVEGLRLA
jgi:glutamyl-tRNA reductase